MYYPSFVKPFSSSIQSALMSYFFSNYAVLQERRFEALVRQKVPAKPVNCMGLTFKKSAWSGSRS
ncbi:dihydroorotate dehydrogenase 2 [Escherichia coli]|uniref:Dihydroorotate dehydrogenase 2 n=1 Tax=Escherichia coli TaxID=562 RepID=A0A376W1A4_ECOLX|nr:dihydroorotate dehydrogenase 2 [Escherichia coli]